MHRSPAGAPLRAPRLCALVCLGLLAACHDDPSPEEHAEERARAFLAGVGDPPLAVARVGVGTPARQDFVWGAPRWDTFDLDLLLGPCALPAGTSLEATLLVRPGDDRWDLRSLRLAAGPERCVRRVLEHLPVDEPSLPGEADLYLVRWVAPPRLAPDHPASLHRRPEVNPLGGLLAGVPPFATVTARDPVVDADTVRFEHGQLRFRPPGGRHGFTTVGLGDAEALALALRCTASEAAPEDADPGEAAEAPEPPDPPEAPELPELPELPEGAEVRVAPEPRPAGAAPTAPAAGAAPTAPAAGAAPAAADALPASPPPPPAEPGAREGLVRTLLLLEDGDLQDVWTSPRARCVEKAAYKHEDELRRQPVLSDLDLGTARQAFVVIDVPVTWSAGGEP